MNNKDKPDVPDPGKKEKAQRPSKDDRRRARAFIISALTAGGVFQMNTWQVQAHGNRSTHSVVAFQNPYFSPNDYVMLRQTSRAPNSPQTAELVQLTAQMHDIEQSARQSGEYARLKARKQALEQELVSKANASPILHFVHDNDVAGAVASIEGQGWTESVLNEYLWGMLDAAYLNHSSDQFTASDLKGFMALARPAAAYIDKTLAALPQGTASPQELGAKAQMAEILHNIASFTALPTHMPADDLAFGRAAALKGLQLRIDMNQPLETMRANLMVGQHYQKANQLKEAEHYFRVALEQATALKNQPEVAMAANSLASVLKASNPAEAARLKQQARRLIQGHSGQSSTVDALRVQLAAGE